MDTKRKLPGTLFVSPWQLENSGGAGVVPVQNRFIAYFTHEVIDCQDSIPVFS